MSKHSQIRLSKRAFHSLISPLRMSFALQPSACICQPGHLSLQFTFQKYNTFSKTAPSNSRAMKAIKDTKSKSGTRSILSTISRFQQQGCLHQVTSDRVQLSKYIYLILTVLVLAIALHYSQRPDSNTSWKAQFLILRNWTTEVDAYWKVNERLWGLLEWVYEGDVLVDWM